jgi:hypothetical protein
MKGYLWHQRQKISLIWRWRRHCLWINLRPDASLDMSISREVKFKWSATTSGRLNTTSLTFQVTGQVQESRKQQSKEWNVKYHNSYCLRSHQQTWVVQNLWIGDIGTSCHYCKWWSSIYLIHLQYLRILHLEMEAQLKISILES